MHAHAVNACSQRKRPVSPDLKRAAMSLREHIDSPAGTPTTPGGRMSVGHFSLAEWRKEHVKQISTLIEEEARHRRVPDRRAPPPRARPPRANCRAPTAACPTAARQPPRANRRVRTAAC